LAFDIAYFFPSFNHHHLSLILDKAGFNSRISLFFSNYLINRKTQYLWNNFISLFFNIDIDIGQGSTLSPILSALYISPVFHIFEKRVEKLSLKNSYFISFIYR